MISDKIESFLLFCNPHYWYPILRIWSNVSSASLDLKMENKMLLLYLYWHKKWPCCLIMCIESVYPHVGMLERVTVINLCYERRHLCGSYLSWLCFWSQFLCWLASQDYFGGILLLRKHLQKSILTLDFISMFLNFDKLSSHFDNCMNCSNKILQGYQCADQTHLLTSLMLCHIAYKSSLTER